MTTTRKLALATATSALLLATACGGAEGAPASAAPTRAPATVRGAIQGLSGGLLVNGVTFRTSGAALREDGGATEVLAGEDRIRARVREGQVVTVRGGIDDGAAGDAAEIEVHDLLEGEVEARGAGFVVVAGATVSLDGATAITDRSGAPLRADDLTPGRRVEVSGHADARGGVRATSVRESADAPGVEREVRAYVVAVAGTVVSLSFTPGGPVALRVDVGGLSPTPSAPVGAFVEVRALGPAGAGGILTATSFRIEDELRPRPADRVEIEGLVTALDASGFTVGSQRVVASPATQFRGGTAADLVVGVAVEVTGVLGDDGVLHAREVYFRAAVRVEANAGAIDASAATFEVLGLTVHVTPSTELRNLASLAALPAGASVQVRGSPAPGGGLDATRVELLDAAPADRAFLRGVVTAETPTSSLTIAGIAVDTRAAEFRSAGDAPLSPGAFFEAVTPGQSIVKVRWRPYPASSSEPVDRAELEN